MGFTQRQAGGKFTRDEADAFIERLIREQADNDPLAEGPSVPSVPEPSVRLSTEERALRRMPAERLAAELQRRGWLVIDP